MSNQEPWSGQPSTEHLQAGGGMPLARPRGGARKGLLVGGVIAAALLVGGGVWAWQAYVGQGPQPAEALPDDTVAYLSVDLDPSGKQKIEALKTLKKFPAFEEQVGIDTDDDLRKEIFERMQDDGVCSDLDYGDDIEPWLGDRAAVAMLDPDADMPVFVVQVNDQEKAEAGLDALVNCGNDAAGDDTASDDTGDDAAPGDDTSGDAREIGGYAFNGDWVVLAQTEEIASGAVKDAKAKSLADDQDYDRWTSALADPGVLNVYAAPEAGETLTGLVEGELEESGEGLPDDAREQLADFPGGAGTIRFDDGSLEVELASGQVDSEVADVLDSDQGGDTVSTLPESTAVALGAGFREGWGQVILDQLAPVIEEESGKSVDEAVAQAEEQIGVDLPDDVETLLGDSFALALDGGFDAGTLVSGPGPDDVPAGVKVHGDPDEIEPVLEELRGSMNPEAADAFTWVVEGDHVVMGFDEDYLDKIKDEGDLGGSDAFKKVISEADTSSALLFANFDAEDWLVRVVTEAGAPDEVVDNVEPLEAAGLSTWTDDDEVHVLLTVTTGD